MEYLLNKLYGSSNILSARTTQYTLPQDTNNSLDTNLFQNDLVVLSKAGEPALVLGVAITNPAAGLNGAYSFMEATDSNDIYISMPIANEAVSPINTWKTARKGSPVFCLYDIVTDNTAAKDFIYIRRNFVYTAANPAQTDVVGQTVFLGNGTDPNQLFLGYYESYEDYGVFRIKIKLRPRKAGIPVAVPFIAEEQVSTQKTVKK